MELSPRKKIILRAVVDDYVSHAEPVGSKSLVERSDLSLSSATLRNEMSALTDMGYLEQPHTSAGRIPTALGYRKYVDELMQERKLSESERALIDSKLSDDALLGLRVQELDRLIAEAGRIVSRLTNYMTYTVVPQTDSRKFVRFDLFCADSVSFVIVVVTEGGQVRNKLTRSSIPPVDEHLRQLAMALNTVFTGITLVDITPAGEQKVLALAGEGGAFYPPVIAFLRESAQNTSKVYVSGESRLFEYPEYRDVSRAKRLLEYVADKDELSRLSVPEEQDVHFLIGPENVAEELKDTSVVLASYPLGDSTRGIIGLVGPTRMDYSALSARMSYFANRLSEYLGDTASLEAKDNTNTED